jgi:ribosome-associated protein
MAHTIVDVLEERKGEDIVLLDIRELAPFADYFVICSGTSDRMLDALVEAVVQKVKEKYSQRARIEGYPREGWLLADFGDVVLHLFSPERRDYYRLEELWSKGKVLLHLQ